MSEARNAHTTLTGRSLGNRLLGKPKPDYNKKKNFTQSNKLNSILPQVIIYFPLQFKTEEIYSFSHSSIMFTTWTDWT
jgi:hypothetical protein